MVNYLDLALKAQERPCSWRSRAFSRNISRTRSAVAARGHIAATALAYGPTPDVSRFLSPELRLNTVRRKSKALQASKDVLL